MNNIFDKEHSDLVIARVNKLNHQTLPLWGKMSVDQMLAHCNKIYESAYEPENFNKPSGFKKFFIKLLIKNYVVGPKPYPKNGRTAPEFVISDQKVFDKEKKRLLDYVDKTQKLGEAHFNNKESVSFGPLTTSEWSMLFHKHIDHHLMQFGV